MEPEPITPLTARDLGVVAGGAMVQSFVRFFRISFVAFAVLFGVIGAWLVHSSSVHHRTWVRVPATVMAAQPVIQPGGAHSSASVSYALTVSYRAPNEDGLRTASDPEEENSPPIVGSTRTILVDPHDPARIDSAGSSSAVVGWVFVGFAALVALISVGLRTGLVRILPSRSITLRK